MPTTVRWPRPRSGSTRTSASGLIRRFATAPSATLGDVEYLTADYVAWYNQQRLMHRLGQVPPAEAEAQYYSQHVTDRPAGSQNPQGA